MNLDLITDIRLRAEKKTIHELRQIARAVGVARPSDGTKDRLIDQIIKIATCQLSPAPRSARGAPPKSAVYDERLVADIERCIAGFSSPAVDDAPGNEGNFSVADGNGDVECSGVLWTAGGVKVLRACGNPSAGGVTVHGSFITRFGLKDGDFIRGIKTGGGNGTLTSVISVNGFRSAGVRRIPLVDTEAVYPEKRILFSRGGENNIATRMVDLFAPAGLGQRGIIFGDESCGSSELIKQMVSAVTESGCGLKPIMLFIAAAPEDVNCFRRQFPSVETYYTYFNDSYGDTAETAGLVAETCRRRAECGTDVILFADGLCRLEYASGSAKKLMSSAIYTGKKGSLTVIASTSSSDKELEKELLQAANMRVVLSGNIALSGITPAVDPCGCFTAHDERLLSADERRAAAVIKKRLADDPRRIGEVAEMFRNTCGNAQLIKELADG